jgi:Tn3 transposase DDE domain
MRPLPEEMVWLRNACQAMLPRIDLPELLLEVHSWTGFLDTYVHLADISTRMYDLPRSLVALLVAGACNVGLVPVIKDGDEALTAECGVRRFPNPEDGVLYGVPGMTASRHLV